LKRDVQDLAQGDKTNVGEKGRNLSGRPRKREGTGRGRGEQKQGKGNGTSQREEEGGRRERHLFIFLSRRTEATSKLGTCCLR
jgi:hypothetical protein